MKYVGNITILDEGGNVVFDRELGAFEIIGVLIERINFFQKPPEEGEGCVVGPHNISALISGKVQKNGRMGTIFGVGIPTIDDRPKRKYTKRKQLTDGQVEAGWGYRNNPNKKEKPCCGSIGNRHKKDCSTKNGGYSTSKVNPSMAEFDDPSGIDYLITEGDFNDIKDLQHDEKTSVQAASELNLDTIACIRAFACKTWTDYRFATRRAMS